MLNGAFPILVFYFPTSLEVETFNAITGVPETKTFDAGNLSFPIPIPILLDERITGVFIESESKALDVDTETKQRYDDKAPDTKQRGVTNLVTVNMLAKRDSVYLAVFLALNDMVFQRLVSKHYSISYLNGPTTVFNGLLHGFSAQASNDDDLMRITLQISKANLKKPTETEDRFALPKITGATPLNGAPLPRPPGAG